MQGNPLPVRTHVTLPLAIRAQRQLRCVLTYVLVRTSAYNIQTREGKPLAWLHVDTGQAGARNATTYVRALVNAGQAAASTYVRGTANVVTIPEPRGHAARMVPRGCMASRCQWHRCCQPHRRSSLHLPFGAQCIHSASPRSQAPAGHIAAVVRVYNLLGETKYAPTRP